ncbi:hypothetical protein [Psychroserpens sp.]
MIKFARFCNEKVSASNSLAYLVYKILPSNNILFGKEYRNIKKSIDLTMPRQKASLETMLDFALDNVPYYKNQNSSNYEEFPLIDKKIISENEVDFFSIEYDDKNYELITSGGTSGIPAKYYSPKNRYKKEYAYFHYLWGKLGYKNQLRAVIRNTQLSASRDYKINPITKEVVFDAFRNTDDYFFKIYKVILKFKLNYLQAYPSSAYNFLNFCKQKNLNLDFLKGIFLSSESYMGYHQALFENELKLKVISVYGHAERLLLISRDHNTGDHKIFNQYGFFDLIDEAGNSIVEENKLGEIVGTTLDNFGAPLIKYRTGDFSSYKKYDSKGVSLLNEILSRRNDQRIYNKDGSYVSPTALNMHGDFYTKIRGMQYVQKTKGKLKIKIVKGENYTTEDEMFLKDFMQKRLASTTNIDIEYVNDMKTTSSGKFLLLETYVKL